MGLPSQPADEPIHSIHFVTLGGDVQSFQYTLHADQFV